jgi:DNA-directed RNA polymerase subunit beta'
MHATYKEFTKITELLEARNPSNPAVVSEIDGVVSFGKLKEVTVRFIESKFVILEVPS